MYLPNQIIFSFDTMQPICIGDNVWDITAYPKRHAHFVTEGESLFIPKSIEQATRLMRLGVIAPCPTNISTHCPLCQNWYNNCKCDKNEQQTVLKELRRGK